MLAWHFSAVIFMYIKRIWLPIVAACMLGLAVYRQTVYASVYVDALYNRIPSNSSRP